MKPRDPGRRSLLQHLLVGGLLAPAVARSASQTSAPPPADEHDAQMSTVLGPGLHGREQIAMVLYPGFTALDLVGPHYFFGCMAGAQVHLVTTEKNLAPVASDLGLAISPTVTMEEAPRALDVLFLPGGAEGTLAAMQRADIVDWVKGRAANSRWITSVCTGSMILAMAGVLRNRRATSHWVTRPVLAEFGAVPVNERVVLDGNVITGAGVSAGLDFAVRLVELLRGRSYAEALMLQAEYSPSPPFPGGTVETTTQPVGTMMTAMFAPVAERFRQLAPGSGNTGTAVN